MNTEELQVAAFEIILYSGNARSTVHAAFADMREGQYEAAAEKLEAANEELLQAHHAQTKLLNEYANGVEIKIEIIMVHAQDHLMTSLTFIDLAKEVVEVYERLNQVVK